MAEAQEAAAAKSAEAAARLTQVMQPLFANVVREMKEVIVAVNLEADLESRKLSSILHTKILEINEQLQQIYGEIAEIKEMIKAIPMQLNTKNIGTSAQLNAPGVLYKDPGPDNDLFKKDVNDDLTFD